MFLGDVYVLAGALDLLEFVAPFGQEHLGEVGDHNDVVLLDVGDLGGLGGLLSGGRRLAFART